MNLGYQNCAEQLCVCCWSLRHSGCAPLWMYLPLCLLQSITRIRSFQGNSCKRNTKEGLYNGIFFSKAISASLPELLYEKKLQKQIHQPFSTRYFRPWTNKTNTHMVANNLKMDWKLAMEKWGPRACENSVHRDTLDRKWWEQKWQGWSFLWKRE